MASTRHRLLPRSYAIQNKKGCNADDCSPNGKFHSSLFDGGCPGLGPLAVVITAVAGEANGADDFAVGNERNSSFHRHRTSDSQNAQTWAAGGQRILKRLGGALELRRRACFFNGHG